MEGIQQALNHVGLNGMYRDNGEQIAWSNLVFLLSSVGSAPLLNPVSMREGIRSQSFAC